MSLGPRGRKGSTGTGMNTVRRTYKAGPQLRLPKQPKRAEFFTRKQINAEVDRLRSERRLSAADEMQKTLSWEQAQVNWQKACDEARVAHKEKLAEWHSRIKASKEERARKWQETIDYCREHGLPLPQKHH